MNRVQCVALIIKVHGCGGFLMSFSHMVLNRVGYGRDELSNSFVNE